MNEAIAYAGENTLAEEQNQAHCHYMMGLGYLGLRNEKAAEHHFREALSIIPNHYGVIEHLAMI